jgi:hypothetical protein
MDGIYQLEVQGGDANGESALNVSFWELAGTDPTIDAYATALEFGHQFQLHRVTLMLPALGNNMSVDFLKTRKIDAPSGPYAKDYVQTFGTEGQLADSMVVAVDIRLKPGGLRNRPGHWFFWGIPSDAIVGGRITTAYRAILNTFAAALITPLTVGTGTANLQTATRYPSPTPPSYTPVTAQEIAIKLTGMNKRALPVF